MEFQEGDTVYTVARDGARCANGNFGRYPNRKRMSFPIYTGGVYRAEKRSRDGTLTWRRVDSFGGTRSGGPSKRFIDELKMIVSQNGNTWVDWVRHGHLA